METVKRKILSHTKIKMRTLGGSHLMHTHTYILEDGMVVVEQIVLIPSLKETKDHKEFGFIFVTERFGKYVMKNQIGLRNVVVGSIFKDYAKVQKHIDISKEPNYPPL